MPIDGAHPLSDVYAACVEHAKITELSPMWAAALLAGSLSSCAARARSSWEKPPSSRAPARAGARSRAACTAARGETRAPSHAGCMAPAAETPGAPPSAGRMAMADTGTTPPAHVTAGSATTMTSGNAVRNTASALVGVLD